MSEISVIVPVYKVEPYLCRCIDSILMQTYTDFELILVDDGSPDKCGIKCEEYRKKDARVHVIHQKNSGLSAARNTGLDWVFNNSNSKWISFVDSDDWIHPEMLERLYIAANKYSVEISVCSYIKTSGEKLECNLDFVDTKKIESIKFYCDYGINATVAWGKLYKKECFLEIRYPVGKLHEDEFITYKLLFACQSIAMIDAPLYAYFINQEGIMNKWNPKRLDSIEAIRERIDFFKSKGLIDIQRQQEKIYVWNIVNHLKEIEKCDDIIRKQYEIILRKELRKQLRRQRKQIPFKDNKWFYEVAYPTQMRFYWIFSLIINKIKTRL